MSAPTIHRYMPLEQRFWSRVKKTNRCWLWTGRTDKDGYGYLKVEGKAKGAHVVAVFLATGRWPEHDVCHTCDNPPCVRYDNHLFEGTNAINMADRNAKGRTASSGLRNGHHTKPERTPRGATHYNYRNPSPPQRGEANGRAKLTDAQVCDIRAIWRRSRPTLRGLGRQFHVSDTLIKVIVTNRLRKEAICL